MPTTPTRAAAFFDLDRTLIRGSAVFPLAVAAFRAGHVPPRDLLEDAVNAVGFVLHGASDERSTALRERVLRAVAGAQVQDVVALGDRFLPRLVDSVLPESRALLTEHAAAGEDRIIVSASPVEIVGELAVRLGLEGAVGTRSEIVDGRYTGRLDGAFCYGEGKVAEVRRMASERGYDLGLCTAYSDSISDLPFLELVGTAVAVNPDEELREVARQRGWRVVEVTRAPLPGERAVRLVGRSLRRPAALLRAASSVVRSPARASLG
jgi:HAD superfamily hydrolase (TIGR01490 family)